VAVAFRCVPAPVNGTVPEFNSRASSSRVMSTAIMWNNFWQGRTMRETEVRIENSGVIGRGVRMTLEENRTGIWRFTGYCSILLVVLLFGCFAWLRPTAF